MKNSKPIILLILSFLSPIANGEKSSLSYEKLLTPAANGEYEEKESIKIPNKRWVTEDELNEYKKIKLNNKKSFKSYQSCKDDKGIEHKQGTASFDLCMERLQLKMATEVQNDTFNDNDSKEEGKSKSGITTGFTIGD